jgi:Holliday junction DNA helicase RuvA
MHIMIGRLAGTLIEKQPPQIVIETNGVGYEVDVPMSTFYVLPHTGQPASLFIHMVVREDAQLLYGFATKPERDTFRSLIKVSGIGAKIALAILSGMNADELAQAIAAEDLVRLAKVPGIGKKTAERLVLELRGKLNNLPIMTAVNDKSALFQAPVSNKDDVHHALIALGYSEREASSAVKEFATDVDVSDGIRRALKQLVKI